MIVGEGFVDFGGGRAITCSGCLWCMGYCGLMGCSIRDFDSGEMVEAKGDGGRILWGFL